MMASVTSPSWIGPGRTSGKGADAVQDGVLEGTMAGLTSYTVQPVRPLTSGDDQAQPPTTINAPPRLKLQQCRPPTAT